MITNERQYKATKAALSNLENALKDFSPDKEMSKGIHPKIVEAQRIAFTDKADELRSAIEAYDKLRLGQVKFEHVTNLNDLPIILIKARIANGLTQAQLASKLSLKEQQIQRYESEQYSSVGFKKLIEIAEALSLKFSLDATPQNAPSEEEKWNAFPVAEMYKRGWFEGFTGSAKQALQNSAELLQDFFDCAGTRREALALYKKNVRTNGKLNQASLFAWKTRVLIKAQRITLKNKFKKELITPLWIKNLVQLSSQDNNLLIVVKYLREAGIRVVIEPHLPETHLDGASLLMENAEPVIALTLRHDRLDNFWFVLMHELAHIVLHLGRNGITEIFDDLDTIDQSLIEDEADRFSLNALIDDNVWKKSLVKFNPSEKTILAQAKALNISPAIVAGRIRKETGKYHLFSNLVGNHEVRKQFLNELT